MTRRGKSSYEFGPFQIDTVERLLTRGGEVVLLPPKAVDTLLALVANSGRILTRDELMGLVWPDTHVEPNALDKNITQLRKVLGDQFIRNFPKRGFRFAPVTEKVEREPAGLAVLLLKRLSSNPSQEPFVEGMNQALLTSLAKISALRVYQATPGGFDELAGSGKVEAAVQGACLHDGRQVRITVQLVRARTGEQIWGEEYRRELRDIRS